MDWKEIREELAAPFNKSDIKWRISRTSKDKSKGVANAYVSNRAIQKRLDDVFGVNGWKNVYERWGDKGVICGLSFYDEDKGIWITKYDGADDTNIEATKGGLSNAMKRAAIQLGIGRYLYMLKEEWVTLDQYGKFTNPNLPMWAYSQGETSPVHIEAIRVIAERKNIAEDVICARYFKEEFRQLTMLEYKNTLTKLEKLYEDVELGADPKLKVKK